MRVLFLALVASLSVSLCERRDLGRCDDEFPCAPDSYCAREPGLSYGTCKPKADMGPVPCTSSRDCSPSQPICDSSGMCRGCLVGEDQKCRDANPAAPRCAAPRCVRCLRDKNRPDGESADCPSATPICDEESGECRACNKHADCRSEVCAKDDFSKRYNINRGECVKEEQVLIVDPLGTCDDFGNKLLCTPSVAIRKMDASHRYLVIRRSVPGMETKFSELDFALPSEEFYVIGSLADADVASIDRTPLSRVGGQIGRRGFRVRSGVRLNIEGFHLQGASIGIECVGDVLASGTTVRVRRSLFTDNVTGVALKDNCTLDLGESWLGVYPQKGTFPGGKLNSLALDARDSDFLIQNAVFHENGDRLLVGTGGISIMRLGSDPARPVSAIVNSTFYGQAGKNDVAGRLFPSVFCTGSLVNDRFALVNTLFLKGQGAGMMDGHVMASCNARTFSIGSDDPTLIGGGGVLVNAQTALFKSLADRDFRLTQGSPEKLRTGGISKVVVGVTEVRAPGTDLAGQSRTDKPSIGAFEPSN